MEDILDVTKRAKFDDSITKMTYHSYIPHNTLTLNNSDEIRISINNQDLITLPSQSYLYIKGKLENSGKGHFTENYPAFLFSEARYELCGKEVDIVRNCGISTLLKNMCLLRRSAYNKYSWFDEDDYLKLVKNTFSICLPLNTLMGFFYDYNKVIVNAKQELILKRSRNDANCTLTTAAVPGADAADVLPKVTLESIQWMMPHIVPSDAEKLTLQNILLQNKMLQIPFRGAELHEYSGFPSTTRTTWNVKTTNQLEKPRYVIFAFQTARDNAVRKRSDRFDHCKLKNLKVFLNSEYYPYNDLNLDFANKETSKAYTMLAEFQQSYLGEEAQPLLTYNAFNDDYPVIVVDCSKQNETIKEGVVDIKLEIESHENIPANTTAYCLIIHDKMFEYSPLTNEINKL